MPRRLPTHKPNPLKGIFQAITKEKKARRLRSKAAWARCSKLGRQIEPLCCDPFKEHGDRVEQATDRHHIIPVKEAPELLLDMKNHASLCKACHARVESLHRAGNPTAYLFEGEKRVHRLTREHWGEPGPSKKPPEWEA